MLLFFFLRCSAVSSQVAAATSVLRRFWSFRTMSVVLECLWYLVLISLRLLLLQDSLAPLRSSSSLTHCCCWWKHDERCDRQTDWLTPLINIKKLKECLLISPRCAYGRLRWWTPLRMLTRTPGSTQVLQPLLQLAKHQSLFLLEMMF